MLAISAVLLVLAAFALGCARTGQQAKAAAEQKASEPSPPILTGLFKAEKSDASWSFFLADDSGNSIEIRVDAATKFTGGQSAPDFDGKRVTIVGKYKPDVEFIEAVSIEPAK